MCGLVFVINLVIFTLISYKYGVEGLTSSSHEDDIELEGKLMILNKPPITTFQTKGGIYDCIDIYKQPALDHPLLMKHKIQMKPSYHPGMLVHRTSSRGNFSLAMLKGINCPKGTVPIRRTEKEDLIRAKHYPKGGARRTNPQTVDTPSGHVAVLKSSDNSSIYYGVDAYINVYNIDVKDDQYSTAQVWIQNGPVDQYTTLQAGWMVSPKISGNKDTRIFIYWTAGDLTTNCYNHLCPGFVQVHRSVGPTSRITTVSTYGGIQYAIRIAIFQDNSTGNWWLRLHDRINVGYWPNSVVPQIHNGASFVAWGGMTSGPSLEDSPPMGNGHYPHWDFKSTCFIEYLHTINTFGQYVEPIKDKMVSYVDNPQCYGLNYYSHTYDRGQSILFGGPGGRCGL